jgi:hypothetical protein
MRSLGTFIVGDVSWDKASNLLKPSSLSLLATAPKMTDLTLEFVWPPQGAEKELRTFRVVRRTREGTVENLYDVST